MSSRIYIGNLPMDVRERELDDLFYKVVPVLDTFVVNMQNHDVALHLLILRAPLACRHQFGRITDMQIKRPHRPPAFGAWCVGPKRPAEDSSSPTTFIFFDRTTARSSFGALAPFFALNLWSVMRACSPAFISFSDPRDADDAVRYRDGCDFAGGRIRVEVMRGGGGGGGPPMDVERAPPTSQYRVIVEGLPKSASWQDLKDHFKKHCSDVW